MSQRQHSQDFKALWKSLMVVLPPTDKELLLKKLASNSEYLQAMLVTATYYNVSSFSLLKLRKKVKTVARGTISFLEDSSKLLSVLKGSSDIPLVSLGSLKLFECAVSPAALGVTLAQARNLSLDFDITLEEAHELLVMSLTTTSVKYCGVCGRGMKVLDASGACKTCASELKEFMEYRRGAFKVPINAFNFKQVVPSRAIGDTEVHLEHLDYLVVTRDGQCEFTHVAPKERLDLPLPFESFQKTIHI